ncbi:hypothetical protein K440DRAFT_637227 [Wilcoxina mikolae CBS 423.85]|nr:hypothetical protein K440DRAFT_637227 [Wilcoxina mikolae CBS 423.85]
MARGYDAYTRGGAFTTVGRVIAAPKHPPISLVMATINERILEVLQFMKTHGCTSPSNFLRAMCTSREPDIKQITCIMLGSRGVFLELVDKLFASHDAASIFQLTYESPMCQLALRVILKKLTDKLNQISRHREVRRPASNFAEVDWESLNFERIGEAYRKAVPATSELIEALCGIPRLVHGVHCTDSDKSLQGTDHLGLYSPIPPDKKKIMSVVVMSLLGFAWSQRANLLQSDREHFGDGGAGRTTED